MDQNLEPKTGQPKRKLKAIPLSLQETGIYFLGATSPRSFVGYIEGGMTDEELQEYAEQQERLKPACMKKKTADSQDLADAEGFDFSPPRFLETIPEVEEEDEEETTGSKA